jgi:hypothetical protein
VYRKIIEYGDIVDNIGIEILGDDTMGQQMLNAVY